MNASEQILKELLMRSQEFGCEYENGLSSHLPMALVALQRIGASGQQLTEFYSYYSQTLEKPAPDDVRIDPSTWLQFLGRHQFNQSYRKFFLEEIKRTGAESVLSIYLPQLMEGISGGAFHPLIRLAYGIEESNSWEMAEALASWCMAYQTLGPISVAIDSKPSMSLDENLKELAIAVRADSVTVEGETVFARFKCVAESAAFKKFCAASHSLDLSLPKIADAAVRLYLSTSDSFIALHCVTATHALRIAKPYLNDLSLNRFLWQAVCATYVIVQFPSITEPVLPSRLPSWDEIFDRAKNQTNDHVIKFAYSCHCEFQQYRNPLYQLAAARKVKL